MHSKFHSLPYILAHKPTIPLNFNDKALGLAYTRSMPHSHTLAAVVGMA